MTEEEIQKLLASGKFKGPKLRALLDELEAIHKHRTENKMLFFQPVKKQFDFFAQGATFRERLFEAGNQTGKTYAGAEETACHLTGRYPEWWRGKRFDHPIRGWAIGLTSLAVRDTIQKHLCGEPGIVSAFGSGLIPKKCFSDKPSLARGVTDAYDTIFVTHETNGVEDGISRFSFKSAEQGREKLQGDTLDFFWCDEEPGDEKIYFEILARLTGQGMGFMTFTPLLGRTPLWERFHREPHCGITHMELMDPEVRPDLTPDEKNMRLNSYAEYERDCRAKGIPLMGEGRVFTVEEEKIKEPPLEYVPMHWPCLWGIDFGMGHPFAAVLGLWDRDNDVVHIRECFKQANTLVMQDAARMKAIAINVPVAWPQDGHERDKTSGTPLRSLYAKEGLVMLPEHAQFSDGSRSTEAGILMMDQMFRNGKLRVAAHLSEWFEEYRYYHRKDGQIVKVRDDLMSATRVLIMSLRLSKIATLGGVKGDPRGKRPRKQSDEGLDWLFD